MNELISVIIPVYNVEKYLCKCVDSVINQTYKNLEIILVDDGSTDDSGQICDKYASMDKRIIVIHQNNAGLSAARNAGIDIARGDFLNFLDSDDWMSLDAYEYLLSSLNRYDADCVGGKWQHLTDNNGKLVYKKNKPTEIVILDKYDAMRGVLVNGSSACNRLFKKEAFNSVRFPVGKINEDTVAILHVYSSLNKIVFMNRETYFYRKRPHSITTSKFSLKRLDVFYNARDNMHYVEQDFPVLADSAHQKYVFLGIYCYINLLFLMIISKNNRNQIRSEKKKIADSFRANPQAINEKGIPLYQKLAIKWICIFNK